MNRSKVTTGKPKIGGAVFRAPAGTTLPTSASASLNGAFVELGYVSEDGVKNNNSANTSTVYDWGGTPVLNEVEEKPDEWTLKLIEATDTNVLGTVYGDGNVTVNAGAGEIAVQATGDQPEAQAWVIDMRLKGGALKRVVIPVGELASVGEITYDRKSPVGYELTIKAMDDGTGHTHYEYIKLADGTTFAISLDKATVSVAHGSTTTLVATTTPAGGRVIWGTSAPGKATVDQSGVVTGVAAGSAVITAYFGGLTASCTVTVT